MVNIYTFNNETMYEDLQDNNIKEEDIERVSSEIISELRLGKMVEFNGNYVIGALTAYLLFEKYKVNSYEELLI